MNSIRVRLLIVLLAVGLIPMVVVMTVTNGLTRRALADSEREKIAAVAHEVTRQTKRLMRSAANDLVALQGNKVVTGEDTPMPERVAEMRRLVRAYQMFDDITLYDWRGEKVESTTSTNHPEPTEKTRWFKTALQQQRVITSRPHRVIGHEGLHLKVYIPLKIAGYRDDFILRARLKFQPMWDLIDGVEIGERGQALLLDERGTLIAARDKEQVLRPFSMGGGSPFWKQNAGEVEIGGESHYYQSEIISPLDTQTGEAWVVACLRPRAELMRSVRRAVTIQTAIASMALLAVALLGMWLAKRFSEPVIQASAAARRVSEGNLHARVPETGATELRQLATSFNSMVEEVANHRYQLEAIVDSRTKKLVESRRELENTFAQLRASYEAAQEGILVIGADGGIIAANERVVEYFGIDGGVDEMHATNFAERAGRCFSDAEEFRSTWDDISTNGDKLAEGEWELVAPKERVLSVYSAPVKNPHGERIARFWTFQDVTEQRTLQRSLEQAQKMEAVGRLAGGVAHDFNNLLTGILGNLSLIDLGEKGSAAKANQAEHMAKARKAGKRAAELVKQLLGFSRRSHLELEYCDVNEVVEDVQSLLSSTIDRRISIEVTAAKNLWSVEVDPTQVEQVVMNMCVNAKDAMEGNPGEITLSTRNISIDESEIALQHPMGSAGDFVLISVADDGSGIPQELMDKIFDPFFTTKEQGKGTGLGLATSYGIVQQHGGWIECESEPGEGTIFNIYLPRKDRPVEAKKAEPVDRGEVRGGTETILLVDDEEMVRCVAEGVLKHHGYEVLVAGDGEEALEVFAANSDCIKLVLLDLTMPKLSGRETLAALREGYGSVPVVVCSGYMVDLNGFEQETGYRPDAAIQKPYNVKDLARKVREVIDEVEYEVLPS